MYLTKMHIQDIPRRYIPALAEVLQSPLGEGEQARSTRIKQNAKELPPSVKASRLERLLLPPLGHLCPMHKFLDFPVVEAVLRHVQLEVGIRLNNLVSQCQLLSPEQYTRVMRLRTLHGLWLDPDQYEKTFLASTKEIKWKYQADECEACILSNLTGDLEVLLDLRCVIRSRATTRFVAKYGNPRLEIWVQVWIEKMTKYLEMMSGKKFDLDAVILRNEGQAVAMKQLRGDIHLLRKKMLKIKDVGGKKGVAKVSPHMSGVSADYAHRSRGLCPVPEAGTFGQDQPAIDDQMEDIPSEAKEAEFDMMDPYTALTSTPYLPAQPNPHTEHGQQFIDSPAVSADPSTRGQSPYQSRYRIPERESTYSLDMKTLNAQYPPAPVPQDEQEQAYVPPRLAWKQGSRGMSTVPLQGRNEPVHDRRRDSWETERINFTSSVSTASRPRRPQQETNASERDLFQGQHHRSQRPGPPSQQDELSKLRRRSPADELLSSLSYTPSSSSGPTTPPQAIPMTASTRAFVDIYDEVANAYAPLSTSFAASSITTLPVSPSTKSKMTPARLGGVRKISIGGGGGGCSSGTSGYRGKENERKNDNAGGVIGRNGLARSKTTTTARATTKTTKSQTECDSSWGEMYQSQMHLREDLGWFFGGK